MTRRGLFKTLFSGIFSVLGWNRIKTRPGYRFIAEFKPSTMPAHQEWQVAILHVINGDVVNRWIPDAKLIRSNLGFYTETDKDKKV